MSIPVLVVDVDGVLLHDTDEQGRHWSANLQSDLGVDREQLWDDLFRPHWPDIAIGKIDLLVAAQTALRRQGACCTGEEFLSYWFQRTGRINGALLEVLTAWSHRTGAPAYLATNQESRRARYLWNELGFRDTFSDIVYSARLGAMKPMPEFYSRTREIVGNASPGQILFFDDRQDNVEAACRAGWQAIQFKDVAQVEAILQRRL